MRGRLIRGALCAAVTAGVWSLPLPAGLDLEALHMFALFAGTILALVLQPLPNSAVVILAMTVGVGTGVLTLGQALGSWANATVWLVFSAFVLSRGFIRSGLGRRIAYSMTRAFGDSTLKLAYVLAVNDSAIAPATPSNTARAGGVLFPIASSLVLSLGSHPGPTARRAGAFLLLSSANVLLVTSAMFMTLMVSNSLIVELARSTLQIEVTWAMWFQAASVPGLVALVAIPLALYRWYPPDLKRTPDARRAAADELARMVLVSLHEKGMAATFLIVLVLWATSTFTGLEATVVGLVGVSLVLVTGVVDWQDVLEDKAAWDVFIWLGGAIGLAGALADTQFIQWAVDRASETLAGVPWVLAWLGILLVYFYAQYGFVGVTPHVVLMYSACVGVAVAAGTPPYLAALSLGFASSLCGTLTHFSTAPAAIFFGAGYVDQATWWKVNLLISVLNLGIWIGLGSLWWRVIGLW